MADNNIIHADTDKLDTATFWAYGQELQHVIDTLTAEVAACLPLATEERDDSDTKIRESVNNQLKYINFLLSELRDLSQGDANQVAMLGQLLTEVEEVNQQAASFDGSKH